MQLQETNREFFVLEYEQKQRSFADIAHEFNTYPNAVRRRALKLGIVPRDKSEAQSSALKSGRHNHPTKGKVRPDNVKIAISEGVSKSWENLPDEKRLERVEQGRKQWEALTPDQRSNIQKQAITAVRKASKEGSKLEKFIAEYLKNAGYLIEFHKKNILSNEKLEVDIFLPSNNIAIEVDGPSHFMEIWGNNSLNKVQKADNEKNGLLLLYDINVIRIKQIRRNLSDKNMRDTVAKLQSTMDQIVINNTTANVYNVEVI